MIDAVETQGNFRLRLHHCCNAGGIASYPEWAWDIVRCEIILYGTGDLAERMGMKPVMTVKTTVSTIKDFDPDTSISYGRQIFTTRPSRIAVLPVGYADGLLRSLSGKGACCCTASAHRRSAASAWICAWSTSRTSRSSRCSPVDVFGDHLRPPTVRHRRSAEQA